MKDLLVFTCDYPSPPADISLLRRSCELYDIDLATYGNDRGWPGYARGKITDAMLFLKDRDEPFAMFVDGRDTIIINNADTILQTYQRIGSEIVIAGEKTCWPDAALGTHYPFPRPPYHNSPWRYINAGGWIGERRTLVMALECAADYADKWPNDDQRMWTEIFLYNGWRNRIAIDAGCQIFQCMGGVGSHDLGPGGENLVTHSFPKVLHFNGRTPNMGLWYRNLTGDLGWKGQ